MPHSQKIALVTGATRGIGFEACRQLAQAGVLVLLAGRSMASAAKAAGPWKSQGLPVEPVMLDVTDATQIANIASDIQQRFGRVDILVNNAGVLLDDVARQPSEQTLA